MWADRATRAKIQQWGVNVLPINHYSSTPSIAEIEGSFEYAGATPPYAHPELFDDERFRATLDALAPFAAEFAPPHDDDPEHPGGYFWRNGQFGNSDALA